MNEDSTVVRFPQPDAIDDPLTAVLRSGARRLLARRTLLHERGFTPPDVGPASDARVLHRDFHYTKLRHPKRPKVPMGW